MKCQIQTTADFYIITSLVIIENRTILSIKSRKKLKETESCNFIKNLDCYASHPAFITSKDYKPNF